MTFRGGRRCAAKAAAAIAATIMVGAAAVNTDAAILLTDPFDYADGDLNTVAPAPEWGLHSGNLSQQVVSGRVVTEDGRNGDHNRRFTNTTAGTIYAGIDVTISAVDPPTIATTITDGYFFHFSDQGPGAPATLGTGFRGRVWAFPGSVGGNGKVRFGLSTTSGVATAFTEDVDPGTQHRIVVSYDFATGNAQLWLDPAAADAPATLTGNPEPTPSAGLGAIAIRVGNNLQGDVFLDNVIVADTFAEAAAIPEPAALGLAGAVGALGLRRRRS